MEKVNINLWPETHTHRLLGLSLYSYKGTEELQKVVRVIEDSLENNFPGVQVNRGKAVKELFQEERMTLHDYI